MMKVIIPKYFNKLFLFAFLLFFGISIVNAAADYPYDVTNATYDGISLLVSSQDTEPEGITYNKNGSKLYMIGSQTDKIYEYDCSIDYDLNTCVYSTRFLLVSGQDSIPTGVTFNDDDSKMYIVGQSQNRIFEYDCSTAGKIDTCVYSTRFFSVSGQSTLSEDLVWNPDGSRVFVAGNSNNVLSQYSCSTNFKVDTCSYPVTRRILVAGEDSLPTSLAWNGNGSNAYMLGQTNDKIYNYDCSVIGDYTYQFCSVINDFSVSGQDTAPSGMTFDDIGSKVYMVGASSDTIYEYNIEFGSTPIIDSDVQEYYNTTNISINLNTTENTNMSYSLDSGIETFICGDCNVTILNLTSLTDSLHNIIFISTNADGQENSTANFTVDTTLPVINNSIPSEINTYGFDGSLFSCTDTNLLSCNISIDGFNEASGTNFTLIHNGNLSYNITALDLAGNSNIESGILFVNPINYFRANDGLLNITNFTYGGRDDVNGTVTYKTFNDSLTFGLNSLTFEKLGYVTENFSFTLNSTNSINTTLNVTAAQIIVNIFDRTTSTVLTASTTVTIFGLGNITTATGQAVFQDFNFIPGTYSVEAVSEGFYTEQQEFIYSGESNAIINLYLLSFTQNNSATLIVPTTDEWDNVLANVDVRLQEYDTTIFGFKEVSQCTSNSNGECQFLVEQSTKSYRLVGTIVINGITYTATNPENDNDGETFLPIISGGEEVLGQEIVRQLRLKISDTLRPANFIGLTINSPDTVADTIVSENSTDTVINVPIDFLAINGLSYTVCFEIYVITGSGFNEVMSPVCDTGSSGLLPTADITLNNDFDYQARITVQFDGGNKETYQTYNYPSNKSFAEILNNQALVPNMVMFFWTMLLAVSLYMRNLALWSWGAMFLAAIQIALFANLLVASSSVILIVINIIILQISKRQIDLQ